ncbi:MAG: hypothetical protein SFY66_27580 [Oculatellaceae cyanobacterium bins.114]|nr:hypothetical protein [Oculatellaceae cyanobacterium bins.114]
MLVIELGKGDRHDQHHHDQQCNGKDSGNGSGSVANFLRSGDLSIPCLNWALAAELIAKKLPAEPAPIMAKKYP